MYQTLVQQAEIRQQELVAWAARERLAQSATQGQKSVLAQLIAGLANRFARPLPRTTPVQTRKHRARTA